MIGNVDHGSARLDRAVAEAVRAGWRVEYQSDVQAVLVRGRPVNHILHLLLTIVTVGLWAFVWIGLALFGGERREVIAVDENGLVGPSRPQWAPFSRTA